MEVHERNKLIHQLFIGKVSDALGPEKTMSLLKECHKVFAFKHQHEDLN